MQVSATQYTAGSTAQTTTQRDVSGISGQDFMKILIKQLQLQDPFEPMTNQEMISQMATIRELEMNTRLTERLEQLTDQQRVASASGLIGRQIKGVVTDSNGNEYELEGLVTGIEFTSNGEILLRLDNGLRLPITSLTEVTEPQLDRETGQESEATSKEEESQAAA
ncbi:MAG: flagellar hook assembly protein FlgD [Phycisphaerae bacterium]